MNVLLGDCLEKMKEMADNSVDAIVTDPPYFLTNSSGSGFMAKEWDSQSPSLAVAEAFFKSAELDLSMVEESTVAENANTKPSQSSNTKAQYLNAPSATYLSSARPLSGNQNTHSAQENAITKAEALVLCKEWYPNLTKALEKLPSYARFVASRLFIEITTRRNTAQSVVCILHDAPEWQERLILATKTVNLTPEKFHSEIPNGIGLEKESTSAIIGSAKIASLSALEQTSNVTTSSPLEFQKTIRRIISLPCVKAVISECTRSPSFIPSLYELFHLKWARECLRVLKPGGHMLAFAGTRTYHRMVVAIEDAGFEIRDQLQWLFGSGFPKSHNLKDEWKGYGSALKPANEPICLARKPLSEKTLALNVQKWGTGAINVDASRIGTNPGYSYPNGPGGSNANTYGEYAERGPVESSQGRWPANVIFDEEAAALLDEQSGLFKGEIGRPNRKAAGNYEATSFKVGVVTETGVKDFGGASRFFYCAKASKSERNAGLEGMPEKRGGSEQFDSRWKEGVGEDRMPLNKNHHPCVKPIRLMTYLCRLITPPKGIILDPFMGSGTTGIAAKQEGFGFIGIEMNEEYFDIAKKRIGK
jgi:site-specific DNA-methyltransferase (adenine-specific)